MAHGSLATGAWRWWEHASKMSTGAQNGKSHPKQMKQLDVGSLQTQLRTWRGRIASYWATLNKTYVCGGWKSEEVCEDWCWGILPVNLKMSYAVGLQVSGGRGGCRKRNGQEEITKCQRVDSRFWYECSEMLSSPKFNWIGMVWPSWYSMLLHFKAEVLDS